MTDYRFEPVTMAADQQSVSVGGHRFIAIDAPPPPMNCTGCAFRWQFQCSLWRGEGTTKCQPDQREDGRGIVWIDPITAYYRDKSSSGQPPPTPR